MNTLCLKTNSYYNKYRCKAAFVTEATFSKKDNHAEINYVRKNIYAR